ncbi:hypothetical protein FQA39_LY16300 [Lamprigera yunnana]|nr:hypothetical protein FQA39_LY16300 [Lamprigera yunnana]
MSEENSSGLQCDQPDIISQLGTEFNVMLPEYLKTLLLFSGFDDLYSLSKIPDNEIESFARRDFFEIGTVEEVQKVYASVYRNMFQKKIEDKNIESKRQAVLKNKKKTSTSQGNSEGNSKSRFEARLHCVEESIHEEETSKDFNAVNAEQKVQKIAEKYIKDLSKTSVSNELKDKLLKGSRDIYVEYRNESSVKIFFPAKPCRTITNVTTGLTKPGLKWILSNFNRHFKIKHFTESEKEPQKHLQTRIQKDGIICTKRQKKIGITIEGFSTDGDPRCLKGMKINSQLSSTFESKYSPYFQIRFDLDKPVYIQDTVHICTKLKTRLTNPNVTMIMGNFNVSIVHLQNRIAKVTKDKQLLCNSDLDRANTFPTTEYLFNLMKMAESSAIADAGNFGMLGNFINLQILTNVSDMTFLHEYSDTGDENTTQANSIEDYMCESETIEILDDISIFSFIDELKLKQFKSSCGTTTSKSNQYIEVPLKNGSVITVKKTSLLWFYSQKKSRLPTDRIFRFLDYKIQRRNRYLYCKVP